MKTTLTILCALAALALAGCAAPANPRPQRPPPVINLPGWNQTPARTGKVLYSPHVVPVNP